jgi:general secretion pathway protein G
MVRAHKNTRCARSGFTLVEVPALSRRKAAGFTLVEVPALSTRKAAGFTLVEVLVVIVIITILAGVVTVNLVRKPDEARAAATRMQIQQLKTALQLYRTEQSALPTQEQGLEALVARPTQPPIPANYPPEGYLDVRQLPRDGWKRDFVYLIPGRQQEPYEIISYGSDGQPGGTEYAEDISSAR